MSLAQAMFIGVNVVTLLCYGYDKYMARVGGWRVPEVVLHALAAVGGTPGAFVGQMLFRNKTRASQFRTVFFVIVIVQVFMLTVLTYFRSG